MDVAFYESSSEFRRWLRENHATAKELWVGFHKKSSATKGITYAEAVDEALCFGWIDGIRKRIDATRYTIRFTPRTARSIWSNVNINRVRELLDIGLMQPAGLKAYNQRDQTQSSHYSYEADTRQLDERYERTFRANTQAWSFFQEQAPSYQRAANWWVMSAKKEETQLKRLAALIKASEKEQKVANLTRVSKA